MNKNLLVLGILILGIHGLGVLESCIYPKCEIEARYASADDMKVKVHSNLGSDELFDRGSLRLDVRMSSKDWEDYYSSVHPGRVMSSAMAYDCPDGPRIFNQFIEMLEVILRYDVSGNEVNQNITSDFVAEGGEDRLYVEIEKLLANKYTSGLSLAYKEMAKGDSLGLIIKTYLSDNRIFSDTVNIQMQ